MNLNHFSPTADDILDEYIESWFVTEEEVTPPQPVKEEDFGDLLPF